VTAARGFRVMRKISIMKHMLLTILFIIALSSCGTLKISEADRKLVSEGKKSVLVTENREPLFYLTLIPSIIDSITGEPISVDIITVDGKEVVTRFKDRLKANVEIVVEPGLRIIVAECKEKVDSWNRDIDDKSDATNQTRTQTIDYTFEGGKKYRIYPKSVTDCLFRPDFSCAEKKNHRLCGPDDCNIPLWDANVVL